MFVLLRKKVSVTDAPSVTKFVRARGQIDSSQMHFTNQQHPMKKAWLIYTAMMNEIKVEASENNCYEDTIHQNFRDYNVVLSVRF